MLNELPQNPTPGVNVTLDELLALNHKNGLYLKPTRVISDNAGHHLSKVRGRGMEFSEIRGYQAGDDIRQMEWRVTARTGKPHIKLYQEEKERPVYLVVDFNPSMFFGTKQAFKSVVCARLAAMLAFSASHHGDKVGGIIFSGDKISELKPKARKQGLLPLLKTLSDFSFNMPQSAKPLSEVLLSIRRVAKPGSLIIILSDFNLLDEEAKALIARLNRNSDVIGFHIADVIEKTAPLPGYYAMTNGDEELILNTRDKNLRQRYQLLYQDKIQLLKPLFKSQFFFELTTETDLSTLVLDNLMRSSFGGRP